MQFCLALTETLLGTVDQFHNSASFKPAADTPLDLLAALPA